MDPVENYYAKKWKKRPKLMERCCELGLEPIGDSEFLKRKLTLYEKELARQAKLGNTSFASQGPLAVKPATQGPPALIGKKDLPISAPQKLAKKHKGYAVATETWKEDPMLRDYLNRKISMRATVIELRNPAYAYMTAEVCVKLISRARAAYNTRKYLQYIKEANREKSNSIPFTADSPAWSPITPRSISEVDDDDVEDPVTATNKSASADRFAAEFNAQHGT